MNPPSAQRQQPIPRLRRIAALGLAACAAAWIAPDAAAAGPETIPGLEAWYVAEPLGKVLKDKDRVGGWQDSSSKGHHLINDQNGTPGFFHLSAVNGKPVVEIGPRNTHSVTRPFTLEDHTLFVAYSSDRAVALFSNDADPSYGVILRDDGKGDRCQFGGTGPQRLVPYNTVAATAGFSITVLGRQGGILHSFIDGTNVSSGAEAPWPLRVGRFFGVERGAGKLDGAGLRVAEVLIYTRYLEDAERDSVTAYLTQRYGTEVAGDAAVAGDDAEPAPEPGTVVARLGTDRTIDVNTDAVRVPWNIAERVEPPLRREPGDEARLFSTRDGTRVRLSVTLSLAADDAGAGIRVLLLKNGSEYLAEEGGSAPFEGAGARLMSTARIEAVLTLDAGESIEVIASRSGAPGAVNLVPGGSLLTVEAL